MRTVELRDEVYEQAVRAASARGLTVAEYLDLLTREDTLFKDESPDETAH